MKKLMIIPMMLLLAGVEAWAQDTIPLTFGEAVAIGLEQQMDLKVLENQQQVLRMNSLNARLRQLPSLNINNSFGRQVGQQFQQVEGELIVTNQINNRISSGLNSQVPVFSGFQRVNESRASRYFEEAGEFALGRAQEEVRFTIAQQYLQALLDEQLYTIAKENLQNQKKQLEQIEGFVEAGLRTLSDQYNQQSEVARLETVALNARIQWETDLWILAETLQLEPNILPQPQAVDLKQTRNEWLGMDLPALYEQALQQRKDFREQQLLEQGNQRLLVAAKGSRYPQLFAFFNYNTFFTSLDERTIRDQLLTVYPQRIFGLNLSIPIFNNFDNKAVITRARANMMNQKLESKALERKISQEVKLALENYKGALQRQASTALQLKAAAQAREAISERFRLGVSNFVDLAQANQQWVTAQSDHVQAQYTLYFQEIILDYAMGSIP
ncbi:TolC family protein [Cyclobacterium plantarum]|uniref:TolC family protein n=1 Tax=Cyclobacterium plantarum TaxID=2716263 RepID=UPI003F706F9E